MSDISVRNASISGKINNSGQNSKYIKLRKAYEEFIEKYKKSDFANSPTIIAKELELLGELKAAAQQEDLQSEIKWIEEKISKLQAYTKSEKEETAAPAYYQPLQSEKKSVQHNSNIQKVTEAFSNYEQNNYLLDYIINKSKDDTGNIPDNKAQAIIILAEAGVSMSFIPQILEDFKQAQLNNNKTLQKNPADVTEQTDIEACKQIAEFKTAGIDDFSAIKFTKLLKGKFEDKNLIKTSVMNLFKAGISPDACIQIIQELAVPGEINGTAKISTAAIKSIISLKNSLVLTRKNEKKERENPISQIGISKFQFGDTIIIMKGQEVTYITPTEGETVHNIQKDYDELISKIEDSMLTEFISKYKTQEGEIPSEHMRLATALRRSGICYDQLLPMIDFCLNDEGTIDKQKLNVINSLKKAGALSKDIRAIMSSFEVDENGEYSKEDIKNACDLSKAVTGGNEVCALIPKIRGQELAKEFCVLLSSEISKKSVISDTLPLVRDNEGKYDINAMNILLSLANNIFAKNNNFNDKKFLEYAELILSAAKNKGEDKISDTADNMGIFLHFDKEPENFIKVLNLCKDKNGRIDDKLGEIVSKICIFVPSLIEIEKMIDFCKDQEGNISHEKADKLIETIDSSNYLDFILNFTANYKD